MLATQNLLISEFPRGLREEAAAAGRGGGVGGKDDRAHRGRRKGHSAEIQVTQELVTLRFDP